MIKRHWYYLPITAFFIFHTGFAFAQTKDQILEIYNYYAQEDVYNSVHMLNRIEELADIRNDSLQRIVFDKLYHLIEKKPNDQVKILALAIDNYYYAKRAIVAGNNFDDVSKLNTALKISLSQKNDLLLARLFSIYGKTLELLKQPQNAIFYFRKGHNILSQKKDQSFYLYEINCFDLSKVLYQLFEYEHSIEFGKKCMELSKNPLSSFHGLRKIYILDLIGASYKCLGKADSSIFYYQTIATRLKDEPLEETYQNELWGSIVLGNIGENLLNQGKIAEAQPYIEKYYSFNQKHKDIYNIFLSTNLLARLQAINGKNKEAMALWKSVLNDPAARRKPDLVINASKGLSEVYGKYGQTDSALLYQKISLDKEAEVQRTIYQSGLKAAETQIAFEKLENSLQHSEVVISKIKLSRNLAILSLILASSLVLSLSFWNRARWKYKLRKENLQRQMAEQEIKDSKQLLDNMTQSLVEKSELVQMLSERLDHIEKAGNSRELKEQISGFALTRDNDWDRFVYSFTRVYPDFIPRLETRLPNVNPAELRLSILMKVGLTNTQIATSLGISPASVSKSKYRFKQRLGLEGHEVVENFIRNL